MVTTSPGKDDRHAGVDKDAGSPELRHLYLDPADAGVSWLLDPSNNFTRRILASYEDRQPTEPCDPHRLAADLDDVVLLIKQRHIGIAEGEFAGPAMDAALHRWADDWRCRLEEDQPRNWGAAIGLDGYRLRRILGDSHCNIRGEDPEQLRLADPRRHQPRVNDQGPAAEISTVGDVLCVRVRRLFGSPEQITQLQQWVDDHTNHFEHDKIIVDLRGNAGGGDNFVLSWIESHIPRDTLLADQGYMWMLGDHGLSGWNFGIQQLAMWGTPFPHQPDPAARLSVYRDRASLAAGSVPWTGRMLVITDHAVASAGESCAVILREAMGARVIGGPTAGLMLFGNLAPYVLPRSGLVLRLGTTRFGYPAVEFTGLPVDMPLPNPLLPLDQIAHNFDQLWNTSHPRTSRRRAGDCPGCRSACGHG